MNEQEQQFAFAVAAMIGMVSRGATLAEVRDKVWQYAEAARRGKPQDEDAK